MVTKITVFIVLCCISFNVLACGDSNPYLVEDLLIIVSFGLILACIFLLPFSIILFNTKEPYSHMVYFIAYFFCAVTVIVAMFYLSNDFTLYLAVFLCLFCALPTFHTLIVALSQRKNVDKKRAAD